MDLIHPDDREAVIANRLTAMRGEAQWLEEYRIVRPDGETRLMHRSSKLLADDGGNPCVERT